jgi:hypothetical protein
VQRSQKDVPGNRARLKTGVSFLFDGFLEVCFSRKAKLLFDVPLLFKPSLVGEPTRDLFF